MIALSVAAAALFHSSIPTRDLAGCYSDLYKNDFGIRPRLRLSRRAIAAWIADRPERACGYQDPEEYAADLAWSAECDAREAAEWAAFQAQQAADAAEAQEAARFHLWDYDVTPGGRVLLPA